MKTEEKNLLKYNKNYLNFNPTDQCRHGSSLKFTIIRESFATLKYDIGLSQNAQENLLTIINESPWEIFTSWDWKILVSEI